MMTATAGALQRPTTPFTITLRPSDSVAPQPMPELRMPLMRPPPPNLLQMETEGDTSHSIFHHRPSPEGVIRAIILAYTVDKKADQPYKPEPDTTFREALLHLKAEGYILIHGGKIATTFTDLYHLTMWDDRLLHHITYNEVVELLECNYHNDEVVPSPPEEDIYDTLPCSAPRPQPQAGVGMYCFGDYGRDLDYINPDEWKAITFPWGVSHQTIYYGDLVIDDQLADVWWSLPLSCYLAQFLSQEEVHRRFPYLNTTSEDT